MNRKSGRLVLVMVGACLCYVVTIKRNFTIALRRNPIKPPQAVICKKFFTYSETTPHLDKRNKKRIQKLFSSEDFILTASNLKSFKNLNKIYPQL